MQFSSRIIYMEHNVLSALHDITLLHKYPCIENRKIKRLLTKYHFQPCYYPRSATFGPHLITLLVAIFSETLSPYERFLRITI